MTIVSTGHDSALRELDEKGYCVISDVLPTRAVIRLKELLRVAVDEDVKNGESWTSNGNTKVFMLLNRGVEFMDLSCHLVALAVAEHLLGPDLLLSSITANITRPGNVAQLLHADQQYVSEPWPKPFAVNIIWMLDDFTEENGATRVVPRSHLIGVAPNGTDIATVPVTGRAGSIAVIDGRLWHGSGRNSTRDASRAAILSYYCAPFLRQQENVFRSLRADLRAQLAPAQRKLLGYDIWSGLGVVHGIPRDWAGRSDRSGPTNADGIFPASE